MIEYKVGELYTVTANRNAFKRECDYNTFKESLKTQEYLKIVFYLSYDEVRKQHNVLDSENTIVYLNELFQLVPVKND